LLWLGSSSLSHCTIFIKLVCNFLGIFLNSPLAYLCCYIYGFDYARHGCLILNARAMNSLLDRGIETIIYFMASIETLPIISWYIIFKSNHDLNLTLQCSLILLRQDLLSFHFRCWTMHKEWSLSLFVIEIAWVLEED